jgi:hypothetical protein
VSKVKVYVIVVALLLPIASDPKFPFPVTLERCEAAWAEAGAQKRAQSATSTIAAKLLKQADLAGPSGAFAAVGQEHVLSDGLAGASRYKPELWRWKPAGTLLFVLENTARIQAHGGICRVAWGSCGGTHRIVTTGM